MTKAEYMDLLQKNLERFGRELQEEILEDYRQHFAEGENQGKSDEEIIEELGNIEEMIQELSEMDNETVENKDAADLSDSVDQMKNYRSSEECKAIELDCDLADICLESSEDGQVNVDYEIQGGERFSRRMSFYSYEEDGVLYAGIKGNGGKGMSFLRGNVTVNLNGNSMPIFAGGRNGSAVLRVKVPEKMPRLTFRTGSGDVTVQGLTVGELSGRTGSGDMTARHLSLDGSLELHSSSGDIELRDASAAEMQVSTASGDISVSRANAKRLNLVSSSGDVDAKKVEAEELEITNASGDISLQEAKIDSGKVATANGNAEILKVQAAELSAQTAQGDITIRAEAESCQCHTASGDLNVYLFGRTREAEINTVYGEANLNLEGISGMEVDVSSRLGDINISWRGEQKSLQQGLHSYGDGSCKVTASTVHGDVYIAAQ